MHIEAEKLIQLIRAVITQLDLVVSLLHQAFDDKKQPAGNGHLRPQAPTTTLPLMPGAAYSVEDAAAILHLSTLVVRAMIKKGTLHAEKHGRAYQIQGNEILKHQNDHHA